MFLIRLTFEEQRVFMLFDKWGKVEEVKANKYLFYFFIFFVTLSYPVAISCSISSLRYCLLSPLSVKNKQKNMDQSVFEQSSKLSAVSAGNKDLLLICAITFKCSPRSLTLFISALNSSSCCEA